ncbi:sugar transporter ERD6-like 4, partial [Homarus americanus]|uniref:sugar transporter ERD6-like 4 n=1 Tax=Homarus americanus TaxID=6706 RepID=UPI001C477FDE
MMREEETVEEGEVVVVVPERAVHVGDPYPGTNVKEGADPLAHRFEIIAACVMGLSTFSGGVLEGYTSPAIPTLLQEGSTDNLTEVSNFLDTSISATISPSFSNTTEFDAYNNSFLLKQTESVYNSAVVMNNGSKISEQLTDLYLTEEEASWLGSLLLLGACVGAFVSSWVISLGRRRAVLASAFPRLFGWIMIGAASDVYMLYGGRFLTGVSLGIVTSAAPVYICEIAHSSVRGALSCVVQLGVNLGIFTAALLGTFVEWRGLAVFGAITVVLYFVATLFIPNSPVWLVSSGREDDARETLHRLRGHQYCVEYDLQQIISSKANQYNAFSWRDIITQSSCVFPLGVVALVTVVNRCSGYNAIITYCATFLHQAVPAVSEYWTAAVVTLMQVFSTVGAAVLIDRLGRRKLLMA